MPSALYEPHILPSVLDRLLDDAPDRLRESLHAHFQDVRQLKASVTRDLEALLNARQELLTELPAEFIEVQRSLIVYGLPDFTNFTLRNLQHRNRIRQEIELAISRFEPRLERTRAFIETEQGNEQVLRFRIEAILRVDPAPEHVTFDALLQLNTHEYTVRGHD